MTVPSSGELSLAKIQQELQSTNSSNNYDDGPYTSSPTSMLDAEDGAYAAINQNNDPANRPNGSAPHNMSEWYSYNHLMSS